LAIKALGKRYSPDINFPYDDMDWLLAALRVNDEFNDLVWDELDDELERIKNYLRNKKRLVDEATKKPLVMKGCFVLSLGGTCRNLPLTS
jgi:hypothetical protein